MNFLSTLLVITSLPAYFVNGEATLNLATLIAHLPPPLAYWPLNKKFGPQDASPNKLHGVFRSSKIVPVVGPVGLTDTAYAFGADEKSYLEFARPEFNLGKNSFTISMFIKILDAKVRKVAPLLEFPMAPPSQTAYGLNLWMWPDENHLMLTTINTGDALMLPCSFDDWAFIGAVYDNVSSTIQSFCNTTASPKQNFPDSPLTSDLGFIVGKSSAIPNVRTSVIAAGRIASLSIYKKALKKNDIIQIYKLHQRYAEEPCRSRSCLPETCQASDSTGVTFYCRCGSIDGDQICGAKPVTTTAGLPSNVSKFTETSEDSGVVPAAVNVSSAEVKDCETGWTGFPDCKIPICEEPCFNGTVCTAPDTCAKKETVADAGIAQTKWVIIIVILMIIAAVIIAVIIICARKRNQNRQQNQHQTTGPESVPLNNPQEQQSA